MEVVEAIKREIERIELLNDMTEDITEPRLTTTLRAAAREIEKLREVLNEALEVGSHLMSENSYERARRLLKVAE
jgi:hypothetical protein